MGDTRGWARRTAVVLATILSVGAPAALSAAPAAASWCEKPSEVGNATVYAGVATVGVDQNNIGSTEHDVIACVDPAGWWVEARTDVTDRNPAALGAQASVTACIPLFDCWTYVPGTGAEVVPPGVGVPSTGVDPPADGNGNVAVHTGTGNTACAWVLGTPTCGGTLATGGGEVPNVTPDPDPVGFADYMTWRLLSTPGFVEFCLWVMNWDAVNGAVGCTLVAATQYALIPALMIVAWL